MSEEYSRNQRSAGIPKDKDVKDPDLKPDVPHVPPIGKKINQDEVAEYIHREVDDALSLRTTWQADLEKWYKSYRGIVDTKDFPWEGCSNLWVPITATIIDTMLARLTNPIFSVKPFVTVKGASAPKRKAGDDLDAGNPAGAKQEGLSDYEKARDIEHMLHFVLNKRIDIYPIVLDWLKDALIYGRGTIKIVWKEKKQVFNRRLTFEDLTENIETIREKMEKGTAVDSQLTLLQQMVGLQESTDWVDNDFVEVKTEEIVYDNPEWFFVPVEDFIVAPRAKDIQSARFVAHRFRLTLDELRKRAKAGIYQNVDLIEAGYTPDDYRSDPSGTRMEYIQEFHEGHQGETYGTYDKLGSEVELIEWHGKYDIDNDGFMEDIIATYAVDQKILLSVMENPYLHGQRPFAEIKPFPMEGRFEAQGVPELIYDLQLELNDLHNQRIDNGTITNAVMLWVDPASDVDPDVHKVFPGAMFPARNNEIGVLRTPDVKFSAFREEELIRRMIQDRLGITDIQIGSANPQLANRTATGIMTVAQEEAQRLEHIFRNVQSGVNNAVHQTFGLMQQFGSDEIFYRVVENATETFKTLDAREIQGRYDLEISANSINANRLIELQEMREKLQLAGQFGVNFLNPIPLLREFLEKMGTKNVDDIVKSVPEAFMAMLQENPEMAQALMQQLQGMAGQQPPQQQGNVAPMPQRGVA